MHRPGSPNDRIQEPPIRRDIEKQSTNSVDDDGENAVDREEIGRQRDPRICPIREDMSSLLPTSNRCTFLRGVSPSACVSSCPKTYSHCGRGRPKKATIQRTTPREKNQNSSVIQNRSRTVVRANAVKKVRVRIKRRRNQKHADNQLDPTLGNSRGITPVIDTGSRFRDALGLNLLGGLRWRVPLFTVWLHL